MKTKFFLLVALFLGFAAMTYAQSQSAAPAEKKDAPTVVSTPDQSKTGECQHHGTMGAKTECKWVDANNDGLCDVCGKKASECKHEQPAPEPKKEGCGSSCPYHKECGGKTPTTTTPPKDGQK